MEFKFIFEKIKFNHFLKQLKIQNYLKFNLSSYHRFVRSKDGFNSMTAEEKSAAIFGKKKGKQLADEHGKEKV